MLCEVLPMPFQGHFHLSPSCWSFFELVVVCNVDQVKTISRVLVIFRMTMWLDA